jgi:hypothetical protein
MHTFARSHALTQHVRTRTHSRSLLLFASYPPEDLKRDVLDKRRELLSQDTRILTRHDHIRVSELLANLQQKVKCSASLYIGGAEVLKTTAVYRGRIPLAAVDPLPVSDQRRENQRQVLAAKLRERSLNERFQCALSLLHGMHAMWDANFSFACS